MPSPGAVVFEVAPDSTSYIPYIGDLAYPQAGQVAAVDVQEGIPLFSSIPSTT